MLPPDDLTWLALVIWDEAQGEAFEGQAAVARIVLNRMLLKYASDGTMKDTILWHFQFSGFWFAMEHDHYTEIAKDQAGAEAQAATLYAQAQTTRVWGDCLTVAKAMLDGSYKCTGPAWLKLIAEPKTVLYFNPSISNPPWAAPDRHVCDIGHHSFYRAA